MKNYLIIGCSISIGLLSLLFGQSTELSSIQSLNIAAIEALAQSTEGNGNHCGPGYHEDQVLADVEESSTTTTTTWGVSGDANASTNFPLYAPGLRDDIRDAADWVCDKAADAFNATKNFVTEMATTVAEFDWQMEFQKTTTTSTRTTKRKECESSPGDCCPIVH